MNMLYRVAHKYCQATNALSSIRLSVHAPVVRSLHGLGSLVVSSSKNKPSIHSFIKLSRTSMLPRVCSRGYKNVFKGRPLKTKKAVLKRFKLTGKGELKYQPAGKAHLNRTKSRTRLRRLNKKGILKGVQAKNAKRLIILGR